MLFKRKYKYYLSVIAIFKNESAGIVEWVEHYLKEGVEHFFLIDNGSTDDGQARINSYIERGLVTLVSDSTKWAQVELYNKHFLKKSKLSEWVIVCDLDEFIYARNGYKTIKDYLKSRSPKTGMIRVPWKMFGSSGHVKQPKSVIQGFMLRSLYDNTSKPGVDRPGLSTSKVMIRSVSLKKLDIHKAEIKKRFIIEDANGSQTDLSEPFHQPLNEDLLNTAYLHLNHYAIQSREWFINVKCTRGAADGEAHENVRNEAYFAKYDAGSNDIEDKELADRFL